MSHLKGWGSPGANPTGLFIHDWLVANRSGHPQRIWRDLKTEREKNGQKVGTYESFIRNYIMILKKLGLIIAIREESVHPGQPGIWFPRKVYQITRGRENDSAWNAPQSAFDPRRGLGGKRYSPMRGDVAPRRQASQLGKPPERLGEEDSLP